MTGKLSGAELRDLKAKARALDPVVRLGHSGMSDSFLAAMNEALDKHGLVKMKFTDFKEEKKTLTPQIAERTGSTVVMRVGNVAVFYKERPKAEG
jgi:RNA-binding protein